MKTFRVCVKEVHEQGYLVKAKTKQEAIDKIREGDGVLDEAHFEYSHTLDSSYWSADEETEK